MEQNATLTIEYGGKTVTLILAGTELSSVEQQDGTVHKYLNEASRDFIALGVENALIALDK